jgi:hypothetical protein
MQQGLVNPFWLAADEILTEGIIIRDGVTHAEIKEALELDEASEYPGVDCIWSRGRVTPAMKRRSNITATQRIRYLLEVNQL